MTTTSPPAAAGAADHRKDIDGLRAVAVLAVIANHFSHAVLPGGYLGVDIFFVISGYVITSSLERTYHPSMRGQLLQFYGRRIKRLMPALLVMVLIAGAVIRLFDGAQESTEVQTVTGVMSIFGLANVFLFFQAVNYFGESTQLNPFSHTWSLGVEEQFYLLYPFLLQWRRPASSKSFDSDRLRLAAIAVLSVGSLVLFVIVYQTNLPAAYFLMPFRFWELGIGCLLALASGIYANNAARPPVRLHSAVPVLGLAASLVLGEQVPVASTILAVLSAAALIGSTSPGSVVFRVLSSRAASYLGSISYSLYLWHWPVICVSRWTIGIHVWSLPFQLLAILLLSMASYHLIENPLRRAHWFGRSWAPIVVGPPIMAAAAGLIVVGQKYDIPPFVGDRAAETRLNAPEPGYVSRYSKRRIDDCSAKVVFGTNVALYAQNLAKCEALLAGRPTLIFVGDSHAMDLFPMADKLYEDRVASVVNVSQIGCKVPQLADDPDYCGYPKLVMKYASSTDAGGDVLVIRDNYSPRFVGGGLSEFANRLDKLLQETSRANMKVVYVLPAPKYYNVGPESLCSRQWYRPAWAMSAECRNGFVEDREEELARSSDVSHYLIGLSRKRSDFFVFDPFDTLCGAASGDCSPVRNGRLMYRDVSHLTEEGSVLLTVPFEQFLLAHGLAGAASKLSPALKHAR